MANLTKLDYAALDITEKNYLTRVLDSKIHLETGNLRDTISEDNSSSSQDRAKAMIFIRRHLDEALKREYLTVEDLLTLWKALRNRYNHQTAVILPRARYKWTHLRIQDFKSVAEYNYALFRITSQIKLCGDTITKEDMLKKTFSTFHASNMLLQHQSECCFPRSERHNPPVMIIINEDVATIEVPKHNSGPSFKNVNRHKGKAHMNNALRNSEEACHRCGGNGHWAHTGRTPKHLVDLYQASFKEKGVETNFLDQVRPMDIPNPVCDLSGQLNTAHLDVPDFIVEKGNEVYRSD
ncbi:uncharacterized protein [Pyrus communis]|uniref:uncharacterized protein n=1 Tax=Pyrus communis TaxID=23211 RepID=UPI0035C0FDD2